MQYIEAQNLSQYGIAVYGNIAMKDILWPKDSLFPYMWVTNGYLQLDTRRFELSDKWEPLLEENFKFRLYEKRVKI